MKIYKKYIKDVLSGKVPAGELTKLAIKRHLSDLEKQGTKDFPFYFDENTGARWIKFASLCNQFEGRFAGQPLILEPWQQFYFMLQYGWLQPNGKRRFRNSYLEVGRKNGKTTMCAVKAAGHILIDKENAAQAYFIATKEDQARIGFDALCEIIKATSGMGIMFTLFRKSVISGNSYIRVLGSDSKKQDGFNPSYAIIDEYHSHPTSGMLNVIRTGMGMRESPMIDIITTAGFNRTNPCYQETRTSCIKILKGIIKDETQLALIYTADEGDDWHDKRLWVKSNPNIHLQEPGYLDMMHTLAINEGGSMEVEFKTKNLNIWTDAQRTWIPDDVYMRGAKDQTFHGRPLDLFRFAGRRCKTGLDLASTRDLCAWSLAFKENEHYRAIWFYFLPEDTIKERSDKGLPYGKWVNEGYIIATPGNVIDYGYIRAKINEVNKTVKIDSIEYDRWNSSQLVIDLQADGFTCNPFGQGFASMSAPTKEVEKLIYGEKIDHGGNPVARWNFSNVSIRTDPGGNIKIDKDKSGEKVDGAVSLVMAIGGHLTPSKVMESPYMTRGVRVL